MLKVFLRVSRLAVVAGFIAFLTISGCQKEGAGCFESTGEITTEDRPGGDVRIIEMYNNVDVFLTQQDVGNTITVEAGENLIKGISTEIYGNRLVVKNNNYCNWTRDFNTPINVYVPVRKLDSIVYRSSGNIMCKNRLLNDSIQVDVYEGSGSINLNLGTHKSRFFIHEGTVDLTLTGETYICILSSHGFGPVNALDFGIQGIWMDTESPNDCYINVNLSIDATIKNIGNIYYTGNPSSIAANRVGDGKLIKLD